VAKKKVSRKSIAGLAQRTGATIKAPPKQPKRIKKTQTEKAASPAPAAIPVPAPAPPPSVILSQAEVVAAIEGASANTQKVLLDLTRQIEEIKQQLAARPTEWIFDWERDRMGRTSRIKASVPNIKKLLN